MQFLYPFLSVLLIVQTIIALSADCKITEIFFMEDEFCKFV